LRVFLLGVSVLLAVPFAGQSLDAAGRLIAAATDGFLTRESAVLLVAVFLFLHAAIGGWRAVVLVVAGLSALLVALIALTLVLMAVGFDQLAMLTQGPSAIKGALADAIPGVMQYSAGIGKEVGQGGPWTTLAILSTALSFIGLALSPAFGFLVTTTRMRSALAFQQVWMIGGLAAGLMVLAAPIFGAELAVGDPSGAAVGAPEYGGLLGRLGALDPFAGLALTVLLLASVQLIVAFFVAAAANLISSDVIHKYMLPEMSDDDRRLAARIVMAVLFAAAAALASFAPVFCAIAGSVSLSLAAQLLPAAVGLCFAPWVSRSGVITGLIFGVIFVLFTEPPGLVAFEGLFLDLPWGRWPLTIHSAGWGLAANISACLLVSLFTRSDQGRVDRDALHSAYRTVIPADSGSRTNPTAAWSLTFIWTFLAVGPGAILGNQFFSKPIFTNGGAVLGVPSLWIWQIAFWLIGVLLVWWLAYPIRLSQIDVATVPPLRVPPPATDILGRRRTPRWISLLIERVAER
jgi:Na+/proline symporter